MSTKVFDIGQTNIASVGPDGPTPPKQIQEPAWWDPKCRSAGTDTVSNVLRRLKNRNSDKQLRYRAPKYSEYLLNRLQYSTISPTHSIRVETAQMSFSRKENSAFLSVEQHRDWQR